MRHAALTMHRAALHTAKLTRENARARLEAIDRERPFRLPSPVLTDRYQRQHTYLRISLTERCNLRCKYRKYGILNGIKVHVGTYCMPEEGVTLSPSEKLLSTAEIVELARLFVEQGVTKIRLTGGEPTLRRDLVSIIDQLNDLRSLGLQSIAMTTNGIVLKNRLKDLIGAGLDSLNISLDTMDPHLFEIMTRRRGHQRVLDSIDMAIESSLKSVKVNCVVMRSVNDHECVDFVEFLRNRPITVRFIEYMPFDGNQWKTKKMVPYTELLQRIEQQFGPATRVTTDKHDTSKIYSLNQIQGRVGFITSMSDHFCGGCNRLRITADGNIKVCLFDTNQEVSLRDQLRGGATSDQLLSIIQAAVQKKHFAHAGKSIIGLSEQKNRPMILIGG